MTSKILNNFFDNLTEGEARQLVSHFKKHSFDGGVLTTEGQKHLRESEIMIEQPAKIKSEAQLKRERALDILIEAEREANKTWAEAMTKLADAPAPSVPGSGGGYGPVNDQDNPAAQERYNRAVAARNLILDEAAEAQEAQQAASGAVREAARTLNQDGPLPARQRRRLPSIFKG